MTLLEVVAGCVGAFVKPSVELVVGEVVAAVVGMGVGNDFGTLLTVGVLLGFALGIVRVLLGLAVEELLGLTVGAPLGVAV